MKTNRLGVSCVLAGVLATSALVGVAPTVQAVGDIAGTVWHDTDDNGAFDPSVDVGVEDVVVRVVDSTGTEIASVDTDAAGAYAFSGVADGAYAVEVQAPADFGFVILSDDSVVTDVTPGDDEAIGSADVIVPTADSVDAGLRSTVLPTAAQVDDPASTTPTTTPETTDPETTEPVTTEPVTSEPETTEPETIEPETPEPETADVRQLDIVAAAVGDPANISGTVWTDINADSLQGDAANNTLGTNILTQADTSQPGSNTYGDPNAPGAGVETGAEAVQVCLTGSIDVGGTSIDVTTSANTDADGCVLTDADGVFNFDLSDIDPAATGTGDLTVTVTAPTGFKFSATAADNEFTEQPTAPTPPDPWTATSDVAYTGATVTELDAALRPRSRSTISTSI